MERRRKKRQTTEGWVMNLTTSPRVQKLPAALHDNAKDSPQLSLLRPAP